MKDETRMKKLRATLYDLQLGKHVQNRKLQTLLGDDGYARYSDDCAAQKDRSKELREKPSEIVEYERRLKNADFAYSKADNASRQGRSVAKKMFSECDKQLEQLLEYLSEHIVGDHMLEPWFDRGVSFDAGNVPSGSPEDFPRVITSRSRLNRGGGGMLEKRAKRQLKMDAVERELEALANGPEDEDLVAKRRAHGRTLMKNRN